MSIETQIYPNLLTQTHLFKAAKLKKGRRGILIDTQFDNSNQNRTKVNMLNGRNWL